MENLKKELQEKGYTFFKMQDYPEFAAEYEYYKKYICNADNNLLDNIDSVRADGHYLKNSPKSLEKTKFNINETLKTFEEVENKFNVEHLPHIDFESFDQYWFCGDKSKNITTDFTKLINKIVLKLYNEPSHNLSNLMYLTYYKKDCFLKEHRDGQVGTRMCAVLIYLNDEEYKTEWGGNIVFERTETVDPIYGNVAILDFTKGNCLHEVKKVVDGYGRYAVLSFVSLGESTNTPNYY
jgi:hypothetical protein